MTIGLLAIKCAPMKFSDWKLHYHKILVLFLVLSLASLYFIFKKNDPLTKDEREWLQANNGKIILAPEKSYPPTAFIADDGTFSGVSADIIRMIEKRLGFHFHYLPAQDLTDILIQIRSGQADVTTAVRATDERSEYMLFTTAYLNLKSIILVQQQIQKNLSPAALTGKRVGVGKDYAVHEFLRKQYPELNLIPVANDFVGIHEVATGILDAFIVDLATASFVINQERITNLRVAGETGFIHSLSLGSRSKDLMLQKILQKGLDQISADEIETLWRKWIPNFYNQPFYRDPNFLRFSAMVLLILLVLGTGLLVWSQSLSQEVELKTLEINQALKAREEFIYTAAHELRTPLTALTIQLQLVPKILHNIDFQEKEKFMTYYSTGLKQLDHFSRLVEALLDIIRLDAGVLSLKKQDVDLAIAVKNMVELYKNEFKRAGCSVILNLKEDIVGHWDLTRIEQVILNILNNAMKYGAGREIEITTTQVGNKAQLSIKDHGIGIDPKVQKNIFERFRRASSITEYRGIGLGLYITHNIVIAHGGTVTVDSTLGQGSTFLVELPLA